MSQMLATPDILGVHKLTVPQLRALCKERRIVGYSKLGKATLVQRLTDAASSTTSASTLPSAHRKCTPIAVIDKGTTAHPRERTDLRADRSREGVSSPALSTSRSAVRPSSQSSNRLVVQGSLQHPLPNKRLAHIHSPLARKRVRTIKSPPLHHAVPDSDGQRSSSLVRQDTASLALRVNGIFSAPVLPCPSKSRPLTNKAPYERASTANVTKARSSAPKATFRRFKPLVVSGARIPSEVHQIKPHEDSGESIVRLETHPVTILGSTLGMAFTALPARPIADISLPPRVAEKSQVHRWAVILSELGGAERRACSLVSRTLRYAVYLSAVYILERKYHGRRLDSLFQQYSRNTSNLWPYLRFREREVIERHQAFSKSFLGMFVKSPSFDPMSAHLWSSPDNERQVEVALRYVLTRMWFAVSVGAYGHDPSTWASSRIVDVQEIVAGEIWQIRTRHGETTEMFYVLEATCEVIGRPVLSGFAGAIDQSTLRADWSTYVANRLSSSPSARPTTLLDHIRSENGEDYKWGISKLWLDRISKEGELGHAKQLVAKRYILANVVANSISGPWMSTSAMAQEFAGLPRNNGIASRPKIPSTSLYLPSHHHIESVHFATSKNEDLHPALAIVQTPGREYYILKDNGMQVGCEEEGVADVWVHILQCDSQGRVL